MKQYHQNINAFGYRFWPNKLKGEGFFIAHCKKMKKIIIQNTIHQALSQATNKEIEFIEKYLVENDWLFFKQQEIIRAIHKQWNNDIALLQKNLYLKKAGVQLGEIKGNDFVPHHELALSTIISDNISKIELTEEQALQYLRKKDISHTHRYIKDGLYARIKTFRWAG